MNDKKEFAFDATQQRFLLERELDLVSRVGFILTEYNDAAVVERQIDTSQEIVPRLARKREHAQNDFQNILDDLRETYDSVLVVEVNDELMVLWNDVEDEINIVDRICVLRWG